MQNFAPKPSVVKQYFLHKFLKIFFKNGTFLPLISSNDFEIRKIEKILLHKLYLMNIGNDIFINPISTWWSHVTFNERADSALTR